MYRKNVPFRRRGTPHKKGNEAYAVWRKDPGRLGRYSERPGHSGGHPLGGQASRGGAPLWRRVRPGHRHSDQNGGGLWPESQKRGLSRRPRGIWRGRGQRGGHGPPGRGPRRGRLGHRPLHHGHRRQPGLWPGRFRQQGACHRGPALPAGPEGRRREGKPEAAGHLRLR